VDPETTVVDADALASGDAFAVLEGYVRVTVTGTDAVAWLNDLLTAEIATLLPGRAVRAFLLTPTGRIRTEVRAIRHQNGVDLIERSDEPRSIAVLLAPYVLSSDVAVARADQVAVVALPRGRRADVGVRVEGIDPAEPSTLGAGVDVIAAAERLGDVRDGLMALGRREVAVVAAEALRVRRGIPRWRVDMLADSFPVGARADDAVAHAKGCFLGQEAIAKIRNLGHPPTVLRHLTAAGLVRAGDVVRSGDAPVGEVTSAAPTTGGTILLARVDRRARDSQLSLADGSPLDVVPPDRPAA
jgi:folate-binding protein YgfZ